MKETNITSCQYHDDNEFKRGVRMAILQPPREGEEMLIDKIAERAASRAVDKITKNFYEEVGRRVTVKFFWLVGTIVVAIALWLNSHHWL